MIGASQGLLFDCPGNIEDYDWLDDGWRARTRSHAVGSGTEDLMLHVDETNDDAIASGYPLTSTVYAYRDIVKQSTLLAHAQADLAYVTPEFTTGVFQVNAHEHPKFGDYNIGDDATFRINDEFHKPQADGSSGFNDILRILGWDVDGSTGKINLLAGNVVERF